ncbi:MAG: hypothetical protein ACR2F4_05350, partial [Thermoleophilaceae bacterium]
LFVFLLVLFGVVFFFFGAAAPPPQRSTLEHERRQLADLRAIGIDWDGEPVRQSGRTELYLEALSQL